MKKKPKKVLPSIKEVQDMLPMIAKSVGGKVATGKIGDKEVAGISAPDYVIKNRPANEELGVSLEKFKEIDEEVESALKDSPTFTSALSRLFPMLDKEGITKVFLYGKDIIPIECAHLARKNPEFVLMCINECCKDKNNGVKLMRFMLECMEKK